LAQQWVPQLGARLEVPLELRSGWPWAWPWEPPSDRRLGVQSA